MTMTFQAAVRHGTSTRRASAIYLTPVEAEHAWTDFIAAAGQQYAPYTRFIYPMIGRSAVTFALAFGPLDRQGVNNMCVALAQRMLDCWVVEVQAF